MKSNLRTYEIPKFGELLTDRFAKLRNPRTHRMLEKAVQAEGKVQVSDPITWEQWLVERESLAGQTEAIRLLITLVSPGGVAVLDAELLQQITTRKIEVSSFWEMLGGRTDSRLLEDRLRSDIETALAHNKNVVIVDTRNDVEYRVLMNEHGDYRFDDQRGFGN